MNRIADDIERFLSPHEWPAEAGTSLEAIAGLLSLAGPALLFLADGRGTVTMLHAAGVPADAEAARGAARAIRAALAAGDSCCLDHAAARSVSRLFGVRFDPSTGEFLGGLAAPEALPEDALRRALPALQVSARLAAAAGRAERENIKLRAHVRQLKAEQETLRVAHSEATISAIEQQEKRLREEQQLLAMEQTCAATEAANRAKSQFLANMSHEIRTPLNAILGFSELLRSRADGDNEAERRDYLETIHDSAVHLLELLNDVLDLSKIEAGCMPIARTQCSPLEIVGSVHAIMRGRAREKGLELTCHWPDGLPATIVTDPLRLKQLLTNLVGNAVKFTPRGSVRLVCRILAHDPRSLMAFEIVDTGIGIAQDCQERIFDAFVQADNSVTREFGGTGLGLAISRRIARALGGEITVQSTPGHGSTFTATIDVGPLDGVEVLRAPPTDSHSATPPDANETHIDLPPCRVLLVEDGRVNRKLISLVLRRAGVEVFTAENGQQGVELAQQQRFDVILMDMQMPVKDGYTAACELRTLGVSTPIVALTAHAMSNDREKCLQAGCSAYLAKPVSASRLLSTLAELLPRRPMRPARPTVAPPVPPANTPAPIVSSLPADDAEFREIVAEFVADLARQTTAMSDAWRQNDMPRLAALAHSLKGTGGLAGFGVFTEPAKHLERLAKAARREEIPEALARIEALAARCVDEAP